METKRTESRLGRFSYLLKGRARPRRSFALMMALVLVGMLSLAGVVSADTFYKGDPMVTNESISLTKDDGSPYGGDFWYQANDAWSSPDNVVSDTNTTTFTVPAVAIGNITWARLWVAVYQGNMTANYYGNETITLNHGSTEYLATAQPLVLDYDRTVSSTHTNPGTPYFVDLNRVTSDYVNEFDVTSLITQPSITVTATTYNESLRLQPGYGRFDGRIKAMVLAVGYDDNDKSNDVYYWVNVGHDTVTKSSTNPYLSNTTFAGLPDHGGWGTTKLDTVVLASLDGKYYYSNVSGGTVYSLPNQTPGVRKTPLTYFGYDAWDIPTATGVTNDITFFYNRSDSQTYYKIFLSFLRVPNTVKYDFAGSYCSNPVGYKQELYIQPPNSVSDPVYDVTNSNIAYNDNVYENGYAADTTYYAAQRFNFTVCKDRSDVRSLTATWIGKGYRAVSGGPGAYLYIFNWSSSSYEQLASSSVRTKTTLTGSKTSGISNYINTDGKVIIVAESKYGSLTSNAVHLDTDYVKLEVTDP